jgi:hypothetical protein
VGPERSGEFAKHACQAKFRWERQDLRAVPWVSIWAWARSSWHCR